MGRRSIQGPMVVLANRVVAVFVVIAAFVVAVRIS